MSEIVVVGVGLLVGWSLVLFLAGLLLAFEVGLVAVLVSVLSSWDVR